MIDNGNELTPPDYEKIGREITRSIDIMVRKYFFAGEVVSHIHRPLSTFEITQGKKKRWAQITVALNVDPLTFLEDDDTMAGKVDVETHNQIIESLLDYSTTMLDTFEKMKVNSKVAEMYSEKTEKLVIKLRNTLLSIK